MANVDTNALSSEGTIFIFAKKKTLILPKGFWIWYNQNARVVFIDNIFVVWWTCFSTGSRHFYGYKLCCHTCFFIHTREIPTKASHKKKRVRSFNFTFHNIDNVLSLHNFKLGDFAERIYSYEFGIKDITDTARFDSYLSLHLEIDSEVPAKNDTLRQKRWFQYSHCKLPIYM